MLFRSTEIVDPDDRANPNVPKPIIAWNADGKTGRALYFTRATAPWGDGPLYHHIGLYAYRRTFLLELARLARTPLQTCYLAIFCRSAGSQAQPARGERSETQWPGRQSKTPQTFKSFGMMGLSWFSLSPARRPTAEQPSPAELHTWFLIFKFRS